MKELNFQNSEFSFFRSKNTSHNALSLKHILEENERRKDFFVRKNCSKKSFSYLPSTYLNKEGLFNLNLREAFRNQVCFTKVGCL